MPEQTSLVRVQNLRSLVFWAAGVYLLLSFIDSIAVTIIIFGVAFFFAIVLDPPIRRLDRRGFSRGMSVGIIAVAALLGVALVGWLAVPPLAQQAAQVAENLPAYASQLQERGEALMADHPAIRDYLRGADLQERFSALGASVLPRIGRYSLSLLSGMLAGLLVLVITLYTLAHPEPLVRGFVRAMPRAWRRTALRVLVRVSAQLQAWVRATFLMMLVIGVLCGAGLWAIGVQSPLLFGVVAGIGEAIPTIGPILSAIPPFVVTLAVDPAKAICVLVLFFVVQQLENNLLVPRVMASSLNLHPVSVLFFVVAMGALMGPLGILLATPLCAATKVAYEEVYRRRILGEPRTRPGADPVAANQEDP